MEAIYAYLANFGLTKKNSVDRIIARWRRDDLEAFVQGYVEVAQKAARIKRRAAGSVELFADSWADPVPIRIVRQLSLYADVLYVRDPILDYVYELRALDLNPANLIQYPNADERIAVLSERLVETLKEVIQVEPLVTTGVVQFVPTQLVGGIKDPRAMYADDLYGPKGSANDLAGRPSRVEEIPKAIREYASSKIYVHPVRIVDDQHHVYVNEPLSPTRMISVGFPGDPTPKIFNLFEIRTMNEETRTVGMLLDYRGEGEPPDPATFENWVRGSKDNVLIERVTALERDLSLAALAGARLLTNLPTSHDLACLNLGTSSDAPEEDVSIYSVLQANLPYFGKVTEKQIAKAKENEAAFYEFRVALGRAIREVNNAGKPLTQAQIDTVVRDTLLGPIARVEARMKVLRRNVFLDGVMLAGTLVATLLGGGNTLTGAAAILVAKQTLSDYKAQKAEEDKFKESPGYFYWDITKKARA